MNNLLFICGPTATGKTALAAKLAKQFNGELISADSRQVYQGMDVGTGKDLPVKVKSQKSKFKINQKNIFYYLINGIKLWGYDLAKPDQEFSVAHFTKIAWAIIRHIWKQGKLPIIVGGTGLYLKSLVKPPASIGVKPNMRLRQELNNLTVRELQRRFRQIAPQRFKRMNRSDQHNPRRLIRAIEIASKGVPFLSQRPQKHLNVLWIGLTAPLSVIDQRIGKRVIARAKHGMNQEVNRLMKKYPDWSPPAFSATGYREWRDYLQGKITQTQAIHLWQLHERQYARRQLTWFKAQPHIHWFDLAQPHYRHQVVELVKNWYPVI